MACGALGELVNANVAGAVAGHALGVAASGAETLSAAEVASEALASGVKGLLGSASEVAPGVENPCLAGNPALESVWSSPVHYGKHRAASWAASGEDEGGGEGGGGHVSGEGSSSAPPASDGSSGSGDPGASGEGGASPSSLADAMTDGAAGGRDLGPAVNGMDGPGDMLPPGEFGPKGPLGSLGGPLPPQVPCPDVGGVLFDHCAADLTAIGQITGAYWETESGELVLVGRGGNGPGSTRWTLPVFDQDHLTVALRAYLSGQPIGVSIDPAADYRDGGRRGVTPPDGTPMYVSYLGDTAGTLFGAIMFSADRLLKCLNSGLDNVSGEVVRSKVPGFRTLLDAYGSRDDHHAGLWHRFWFVIDQVELKHDPATSALCFGDVRLQVRAEVEMSDGQGVVDPIDRGFAAHLTEHFDEYASEFPILAKLRELAKIAALAKFLCNQNVKLDLGALLTASPQPVRTPTTTPGISARSAPRVVHDSDGTIRSVVRSIFGGVDLDPDLRIAADDGSARALRQRVAAGRPDPGVTSWVCGTNGSKVQAVGMQLGAVHNRVRRSCDDHSFAGAESGAAFRLRRSYDSAATRTGDFGPGWNLWVPFSLSVRTAQGKRREVLTSDEKKTREEAPLLALHDHATHGVVLYRRNEDRDEGERRAFSAVISQLIRKGGRSYTLNPADCLYFSGGCYVLRRETREYKFDAQGRIVGIDDLRGSGRILYGYEQGRLVCISQHTGERYDLEYAASDPRRIVRVLASDGHILQYDYGPDGCLQCCRIQGQPIESYAYDAGLRLTQVRDRGGQLVERLVYDSRGGHMATGQDTLLTKHGSRISRSFAHGDLISARDDQGGTARLSYGAERELRSFEVTGARGQSWRLEYDSRGRVEGLVAPGGILWRVLYDRDGRVEQVLRNGRVVRAYQKHEGERTVRITTSDDSSWTAVYDSAGLLRMITKESDDPRRYEFVNGVPKGARLPEGDVSVVMDKAGVRCTAKSKRGFEVSQVFSADGRVCQHRVSGAAPVRLHYGDDGVVASVLNDRVKTSYEIDEAGQSLTVNFEWD